MWNKLQMNGKVKKGLPIGRHISEGDAFSSRFEGHGVVTRHGHGQGRIGRMIGIDSASARLPSAHLSGHLSVDERPFQVGRVVLGQIALPSVSNENPQVHKRKNETKKKRKKGASSLGFLLSVLQI